MLIRLRHSVQYLFWVWSVTFVFVKLEGYVCATIGTIGKISVDNQGWCYPACNRCNKTTLMLDGLFTCLCERYNEKNLLR